MTEKIQLCKSCGCMTNSKKGYIYICGKCGKDRRKISEKNDAEVLMDKISDIIYEWQLLKITDKKAFDKIKQIVDKTK